jgi:hypothetical protein
MAKMVDIICESCSARMRLSGGLLEHLHGRAGRITCKRCKSKVGVDARGEEFIVTSGGAVVESASQSPEEGYQLRDPHVSVFPPDLKTAIPPPLSPELREKRRMALQSKVGDSQHDIVIPKDAPIPELRREDGSLTPHTLATGEEEEGLVTLGHKLPSAPSERDATYRSLYGHAPEPLESLEDANAAAPSDSDLSGSALFGAPADIPAVDGILMERSDLELLTQKPRRSSSKWLPWAIAAASLFALGISLTLQFSRQQETAAADASSLPSEPAAAVPESDGETAEEIEASEESASAEKSDEQTEVGVDLASLQASNEDPPTASTSSVVSSSARSPSSLAPATSKASPTQTTSVSSADSSAADSVGDEEDAKDPEADGEKEDAPATFSTSAASSALREATDRAGGCRSATDPTGIARVQVTFAPSGRVTRALVMGPPYAGTSVGSCVASRFQEAQVPAFEGDFVTVTKTVTIR